MNRTHGLALTADNIMITSGSQQALYYLAKIFLDPGDSVICEDPSFVGALLAFRAHQARLLPLPVGTAGASADTFEHTAAKRHRLPKFAYLMTAVHNPTGFSSSDSYRTRIAGLSARYGLLLIEDDPYSEIAYTPERPRSLADCMPFDNLVYLGSFSKTVAPGLRLGWMAAPREIILKASQAKQAEDLCTGSLAQFCLHELLTGSDHDMRVQTIRERYRQRRDLMLEILPRILPAGSKVHTPAGGIFCWVELPAGFDTAGLLPRAVEAGVAYVPGESFFCAEGCRNTMRLNFSFPSPQQIETGLARLGGVLSGG
jgi:2-aminoadipate transaminase